MSKLVYDTPLILVLLDFLNGLVHLQSLDDVHYQIWRNQVRELKSPVVRLHECADWPSITLVAKAYHFWF